MYKKQEKSTGSCLF